MDGIVNHCGLWCRLALSLACVLAAGGCNAGSLQAGRGIFAGADAVPASGGVLSRHAGDYSDDYDDDDDEDDDGYDDDPEEFGYPETAARAMPARQFPAVSPRNAGYEQPVPAAPAMMVEPREQAVRPKSATLKLVLGGATEGGTVIRAYEEVPVVQPARDEQYHPLRPTPRPPERVTERVADRVTERVGERPEVYVDQPAPAPRAAECPQAPAACPPQPAGSLYDDLLADMMAISPVDFESPLKEVPMNLRNVATSILRNNRKVKVASFKPEQARAGIMDAKSAYDPEVFASVNHSRTEAPPAMIISGIPTPNREFRNNVGRAGVRQTVPSGAKVSAYREWNQGVERSPGADADRGHGGAYVAEISQPLLNGFADMENRVIIEISRLQADQSQEEFRQAVIEVMADAMEAYWSVSLARQEMRIHQASLDMAERLLKRELGRKDEGISTQLDVNRAREAASTRAYNLLMAREQYLQAQERLKYYINDKSVPVGMEIYVEAVEDIETPLMRVNPDDAIEIALANRPEMRNADLTIRTSEARRRYARHTLLPELNLIGSVRYNDKNNSTPTSGSSTLYTGADWSVGMEFSMPIGNMKGRANMRRAESELSQSTEEKRNARDVIVTEVRTVIKGMEMIVREIPLNKRAMEAAAKVLEGEWARLELNQTGNSDLLQAQDLLAVAERNHIQSQIRYNVAVIRLLAAEGILLDKMGILLTEK